MRAARSTLRLAPLLAGALVASACAEGGTLGEEAARYCRNEAPPEELAAAARALNLPARPEDFASGRLDPADPVYIQACEYAYEARGGELNPPPGQGAPLDPVQTPARDPHASP